MTRVVKKKIIKTARIIIPAALLLSAIIFAGFYFFSKPESANAVVCFLAGTKISMSDGSYKSIENVQVGDSVISYDQTSNKNVISKVIGTVNHSSSEMGDYYLVINNKLKITPNHVVYLNDKWQPISDAKRGDYMRDINGNKEVLTSIIKVYEKVPTYNLVIAGTHTYYAEDLLVHNSSAPNVFLSAATSVMSTTAQLNGNITGTSGTPATVTVYWGTADKGNTSVGWDYSATATSPSQPQGDATFYESATGLAPGTTYYFRASASNVNGTGWPTAALSFTTTPAPVFIIKGGLSIKGVMIIK